MFSLRFRNPKMGSANTPRRNTLTLAAYAATFTATDDRLRNPEQLRRSPVAPPAPPGVENDLKPENWTVARPNEARISTSRPRFKRPGQTTGTRFAATAAGEMTSMSRGTCQRSVKRTRGGALFERAPFSTKPS